MSSTPIRKFYKLAEAGTAPSGHVIRLDGKLLKTPLQKNFILPNAALAEALAAEWQAQEKEIKPATMPLTQLAYTMIDKSMGDERAGMNAEVTRYAGSDLVCYLATHPAELVKRQEDAWLPLLALMREKLGITLTPVRGIRFQEQPEGSIKTAGLWVEDLNAADFTALQAVTGVTGSVVIAAALVLGWVDAAQAYAAATVDEAYQLEKWGSDELAEKRLANIRFEIDSAVRFLDLIRASA